MNAQEWETMLRKTAEDRKLSGPERSALGERLAGVSDQQAAAFRARAFEIVREGVFSPREQEMLSWLEDVVKLLHPIKAGASAGSDALFTPADDICGRLIGLFDSAKRSVEVCVFTITDDRIADAMLRAHRRGVRLRVITDDLKALDLGADIARLEAAGIALVTDRSEPHMHHKFTVFDRALLANGSYNWTRSAQAVNRENLVLTGERRLIERFGVYFEGLWTQLGGA